MPPIGALAFTPDGSQLWSVSHGSIEIRTWPELELVTVVPPSRPIPPRVADGVPASFRQSLAFHPAGRMAALAVRSGVWLLDSHGAPLDLPAISLEQDAHAAAFAEDGRLLIATRFGMLAAGPDGSVSPLGAPPVRTLPPWIWRAAILPSSRSTIYCVNDGAAIVYSWETGEVEEDESWERGVFSAADGDADETSSWLAADAASGERALVCGRKSGRTWVVTLERGLPQRAVEVEKAHVRRSPILKLPMRTTAHAIHPTEDSLVYVEISGYVGHARLSTGELVRELPRDAEGYAWE